MRAEATTGIQLDIRRLATVICHYGEKETLRKGVVHDDARGADF